MPKKIKKPTRQEWYDFIETCDIHRTKFDYEKLQMAIDYFFGLYQTQKKSK